MEEAISYFLAAVVALLGGDRVYQSVRRRQHTNNPDNMVTRQDIMDLRTEITRLNQAVLGLSSAFERHLGYHEGRRESE